MGIMAVVPIEERCPGLGKSREADFIRCSPGRRAAGLAQRTALAGNRIAF
jgi:hypothetical protein